MGFFSKLKEGLTKTRKSLTEKIEKVIIGYADIDDDLLDELEDALIQADVGVKTSLQLMDDVRAGIKKKQINSPEDLKPFLIKRITAVFNRLVAITNLAKSGPTVILVIGVNGVGKTTTIGKLGRYYKEQGNASQKGWSNYYAGRVYEEAGKLFESGLYFLKAAEYAGEIPDPLLGMMANYYLGELHDKQYAFDKSLEAIKHRMLFTVKLPERSIQVHYYIR